ncbi:hypothetical protein LCGC14_0686290 [marine sediment metagenome]|uniref:Uncharacterized protein n=1 Tax=marine sediment metagenome TaxID=412755 RepID=A0A0F9R739_9ZZZZ
MTPQEKTIDLIKKLLAQANDDATTQAEAAAFAAKAAEIAAREQLELSAIDWTERKAGQPIGAFHFWPEEHDIKHSKVRVKWMEQLIGSICRSQNCRIILCGGNTYDIIGRKGNVEIASYLAAFLVRFVVNMSERDYRKVFYGNRTSGRRAPGEKRTVTEALGFKESWRQAFVAEVQRRLREQRDEIKVQYASNTALVRLDDEADAVQEWMSHQEYSKARFLTTKRTSNYRGMQDGQRAGSKVDVAGRGVNEGDFSETKKIS